MECQVVDQAGAFVGGLDASAFAGAARNYRVVAVVGCQSGGKSTLLNAAFGTAFPVLDAPKSGRRRTTLGVWASIAGDASAVRPVGQPALVVLDVEGADSRERGDGARAFESRTALFALALSDVVVVNMWAHDIGRHSAANYELFETVFAHAGALRRQAKVFTDARPVHILMVIRDHDGESALADIRRVLMGDLENIWDALNIPDLSFETLFKVDVVTLPHKIYSPALFDESVAEFSSRFAVPLKAPQPVPISGFEALASSVWNAVCASTGGDGPNSEFTLDIPKHAALAVHFSCGEVATKLLDGTYGTRIDDLRHEIEAEWRHPVADFGTRVDSITREALADYDAGVASFKSVDREACARRREELIIALAERLSVVSDRYLGTCRDTCINGFEDEFRPMLGGTSAYNRESRRLVKRYVAQYKAMVDGGRLPSVLQPYLAQKANAKCVSNGTPTATPETEAEAEANSIFIGADGEATPSPLTGDESDEEDEVELYTVDRFKRDVLSLVDERRRLGELLLPGGATGANVGTTAGPKPTPWWKALLIRALVLAVNYGQAAYGHRQQLKLQREHEQEYPPGPTF